MKRQTMFEAVGGLLVMERVHKHFYEKPLIVEKPDA